MSIRSATSDDRESIVSIYNEAIDTRISIADTEPVTVESKEEWLNGHSIDQFPIYVYEVDLVVVGRLPKIAEIDGNRYDHLYLGRRI